MSANAETLLMTIEVTKVTFSKPGNDWACVQTVLDTVQPEGAPPLPKWLSDAKKVTVTGYIAPVQAGDLLDIEGVPTRHQRYGWQVEAKHAMLCARRDERALYSFLRKLPHVGPHRASLIIAKFGGADEVFDLLDNTPERLAEIEGISAERASEAAEAFKLLEGERDAWLLCRELDLPSRVAARIIDRLGGQARSIIHADPFYLMTRIDMSFRDCDAIRIKLGMSEDDPRRLAAAAMLVLRAAGRGGDCWSSERHLFGGGVDYQVEKARQSVSLSDALLRQGLDVLQQPVTVSDGVVLPPRAVVEEDRIYLSEVYEAEKTVCRRIRGMLAESDG
jgi:exodeoxyribonuclease V alpha subunit